MDRRWAHTKVGHWVGYTRFELGISEARTLWLIGWLERTLGSGAVLTRNLISVVGRLGFAAGVLEWYKPFLSALCQ